MVSCAFFSALDLTPLSCHLVPLTTRNPSDLVQRRILFRRCFLYLFIRGSLLMSKERSKEGSKETLICRFDSLALNITRIRRYELKANQLERIPIQIRRIAFHRKCIPLLSWTWRRSLAQRRRRSSSLLAPPLNSQPHAMIIGRRRRTMLWKTHSSS